MPVGEEPSMMCKTRSQGVHVRAWIPSRAPLLFVLVMLLHLIPLWAFTYFPSQDGPVHLHIAQVIRHYAAPDLPVFHEYYVLNKNLDPNG